MKPFLTYLDNWFNIHNTNTLNIDDRINQIKQKVADKVFGPITV